MNAPKPIEPITIAARYAKRVVVPIAFRTISMLARLLAGPTIRSIRPAPGVRPFMISATAIGMEPVAQRYIGNTRTRTRSIDATVFPRKTVKNESGINAVIRPAMRRPITSHFPISSIISIRA